MSNVAQFEQQLSDAKSLVERRDMALKLRNNREFKKLILDDYLVQEAARLVTAAGDPLLDEKKQRDCMEMAKGAGHLKRYLQVIITMGDTAADDIPQIEENLAELRAENDAEIERSAVTNLPSSEVSQGGLE
jgi:hypothetical protein